MLPHPQSHMHRCTCLMVIGALLCRVMIRPPTRIISPHLAARVQVEEQLYPHKVDLLDEAASRQLFRLRAKVSDGMDPALQEVEAAILKACGGLPLALRLVGGHLSKKKPDKATWKVRVWLCACVGRFSSLSVSHSRICRTVSCLARFHFQHATPRKHIIWQMRIWACSLAFRVQGNTCQITVGTCKFMRSSCKLMDTFFNAQFDASSTFY
jgi:hypothetical protein